MPRRPRQLRFSDQTGTTWAFDVAFMTSRYACSFGRGCGASGVGVCCELGATLWYDEDDADMCTADQAVVEGRIAELSDEEWQLRTTVMQDGGPLELIDGVPHTRVLDGGCVFSNRAGFPAGAGCALHLAALRRGESPLDWKPRVCWTVPLLREELEDGTYLVRPARNRDWSLDGSHEPLDWWCVDDPANYENSEPVYRALREEITQMCGVEVYDQLAAHLGA